jgi:hypothetical protein
MAKLDVFFIKIALFAHILEKLAHSLFGVWSFLLIHMRFTPSEGPKGFVTWFFFKSDHGSWTIESDHVEWPSSMVQFRGLWCKPDTNRQDDSFANCVADVLQHTTHWLKLLLIALTTVPWWGIKSCFDYPLSSIGSLSHTHTSSSIMSRRCWLSRRRFPFMAHSPLLFISLSLSLSLWAHV